MPSLFYPHGYSWCQCRNGWWHGSKIGWSHGSRSFGNHLVTCDCSCHGGPLTMAMPQEKKENHCPCGQQHWQRYVVLLACNSSHCFCICVDRIWDFPNRLSRHTYFTPYIHNSHGHWGKSNLKNSLHETFDQGVLLVRNDVDSMPACSLIGSNRNKWIRSTTPLMHRKVTEHICSTLTSFTNVFFAVVKWQVWTNHCVCSTLSVLSCFWH